MAMYKDLKAVRGDDRFINLTIKLNNIATDITGWTVWMTIKENLSDADVAAKLQKVVTSHVSPTTGVTQIHLTNANTNALDSEYYYDIQVKDDNGYITTLFYGKIDFTDDRTRSVS